MPASSDPPPSAGLRADSQVAPSGSTETDSPSSAASPAPTSRATSKAGDRSIYDRYFWALYLANFAMVAANATTFRFAEFVDLLGGGESNTGWLVTAGLCGAVVIRFLFGQEIDRLGYRRVWLLGATAAVCGTLGMMLAGSLGPLLYGARLAFSTGLAIVFACSNAHVQTRVPDNRRTEMIAMIGSSGFLGLIFGTRLADLVWWIWPQSSERYVALFGLATALAAVHLLIAAIVTRHDPPPKPRKIAPSLVLLRKYWPGACLLPALAMGAGFCCTSTFLTRFVTEQGFASIGSFFIGYAITAFSVRMVSRTWPARFGRHALIIAGCVSQAIGFSLFAIVSESWMLALPAIGVGFGHAVLFPSVVSLGAGRFPLSYRGTGTMLTMGFFDLGFLLTAPVQGIVAERAGFLPLFFAVAAGFAIVAVVYGLLSRGVADGDLDPELAGRSRVRPLRTIVPRLYGGLRAAAHRT